MMSFQWLLLDNLGPQGPDRHHRPGAITRRRQRARRGERSPERTASRATVVASERPSHLETDIVTSRAHRRGAARRVQTVRSRFGPPRHTSIRRADRTHSDSGARPTPSCSVLSLVVLVFTAVTADDAPATFESSFTDWLSTAFRACSTSSGTSAYDFVQIWVSSSGCSHSPADAGASCVTGRPGSRLRSSAYSSSVGWSPATFRRSPTASEPPTPPGSFPSLALAAGAAAIAVANPVLRQPDSDVQPVAARCGGDRRARARRHPAG